MEFIRVQKIKVDNLIISPRLKVRPQIKVVSAFNYLFINYLKLNICLDSYNSEEYD